jgi:autotransporter-associated beta strand protein
MDCLRLFLRTNVAFLICISAGRALALDSDKPPGQNFDLNQWELTLPVNSAGGTNGTAADIPALQLVAGYTNAPYFATGADGAMVFWCPAAGATTSGSSSPRTELREMLGAVDNDFSVNWSANGLHLLTGQCLVNAVANGGEVAIGQVHAYSVNIPLVILYYDNSLNQGTINATVKYNTTNAPVNGHTDNTLTFANVGLNSPIHYQLLVSNGVVFITVNGSTQSQNFYATDTNWANANFYFKAGDYYVNNGGATNPAQVSFYELTVNHTNNFIPYHWDANTNQTGIQDVPGVWKVNTVTAAYWTTNNGISHNSWPTSSVASAAVFGGGNSGTAGQVSLAQSPLVRALTFNAPFAGDYTLVGPGNLTLAEGATITVNGGNPAIATTIAGSGSKTGFTKLGSGTLWLGNTNNTFAGVLRISAGTVAVGADQSLGATLASLKADELTLDGGTLLATNSFTWGHCRGIYLTPNGGTIDVAAGQTVTMGGSSNAPECIAGAPGGNLIKAGSGTFSMQAYFANPNSYPGQTIVNQGTLSLAGNSGVQLIGAGGLLINPGAVVSVANAKSGLIANGAPLTNLGGIYIAGGDETNGILVLGADGVLTNGSASSRQLWVTNTINLQSGTIIGHGDPVPTNRFYLAGPATLLKTTAGTATIVGTNSDQVHNFELTGKAILRQGILNIGLDDALGSNPAAFTADQLTLAGGTLQINTGSGYPWAANRGVTLTANGGTFDLGPGVSQTVPVAIAGTQGGGLTKAGSGTLGLTAANTYNGATTVLGGTLLVNNASGSGTGSGAVMAANGTTLGGTGAVAGGVTYRLGAQALFFKTANAADTPLTVSGALALNNNSITVDLGGTTLGVGTYRLLNYSGTMTGSFNSTPVIVNGSTTQVATLDQTTPHQINLVVGNPVQPGFGGVVRAGSDLIFSGSGGQAGSSYSVLASTNPSLPLSNWTPVTTNTFDVNGNFNFTNAMSPLQPGFFIIKLRQE